MDQNRDDQNKMAPSRREFLRRAGGGGLVAVAGAVLLPTLGHADPFDYIRESDVRGAAGAPNPGGDLAILNFALLLERLEARFYNLNADKPYLNGSGGSTVAVLKSMVDEIRDHENAHVALLENALGANAAAPPTFQNLDAATLTQFVTLAQTFEDVGVSAYLGQAPLIQDKSILATAGAILAVEARHAGGIRAYRKFAGSTEGGDPNTTLTEDREALNRARTREQVVALVTPFIVSAPA